MPNLLKQLELEELSLVDRPANAQAMVSLFKRDNSQEEVTKMTEEVVNEEVVAEEVVSEVDTLKAENERLRKGLIDAGYVIKAEAIEKKAEPEYLEYEGEKVDKADVPAVILKALEAAAVEKADVALTKRAEAELPHFDVEVAKGLLTAMDTSDKAEAIMEALVAADKAFSEKMEEVGKADVDGDFTTASDKLENLVKSYMDDNEMKKSEYAKAYAAVAKTDAGKALITKSYKGE